MNTQLLDAQLELNGIKTEVYNLQAKLGILGFSYQKAGIKKQFRNRTKKKKNECSKKA